MATRSLYEHATANEGLARYHAQAVRLLCYQQYLESALPPQLRNHARVANLRAGKLVVYAANPAVATKIRQLAPRLADIFSSKGAKFSEIDVKVQPGLTNRLASHGATSADAKPMPSPERVRSLDELSASMADDNPVKQALTDLIQTLRRTSRHQG